MLKIFIITTYLVYFALAVNAQIIAPTASGQTTTNYQSAPQDNIYIFCSTKDASKGLLKAQLSTHETANFSWYKLDEFTLEYIPYLSENSVTESKINNLADGNYKVIISGTSFSEEYQSWVFNNWYEVHAAIDSCDCDFTKLKGSFTEAPPNYIDIHTGNELSFNKGIQVEWETNGNHISSILSPTVVNPPAENTIYTLTISDSYECSSSASIEYSSIIPSAKFTASPMSGDAPLMVTFTNESTNADHYEWLIYRSIEDMNSEYANFGEISDSIIDVFSSKDIQYTYEASGNYMVKLQASKTTDNITCFNEIQLDNYIVADTSYIEAPNFFTPNGDGDNDIFLIKYTSMKSINISIFNRWGKLVFKTKNSNVGAYDDYGTEFAWNGKIGGNLASPGVYYYVVEGYGRDGKKHAEQGFFHLFREK